MPKPTFALPTLEDVARRAEVSTASVSRFFSAPDRLRPGLRLKIQEAVEALAYRPHGAARALASQRSSTIGAVIPTLDNAIFATCVQALQTALAERATTLLLAAFDYDPTREREQIESLIARGVDGLMLTGEAREPEVYALLQRRGIRYANTYVHHADSAHATIGFDNRQAMHKLVGYLHDLGHRAFAMIAGISESNDRASERVAGTREALAERGIALEPEQILERPYRMTAGREALRQLLDRSERPTAVLCGNDVLALGAMLEAQAMGHSVPGDLSITGFDDLGLAKEIPPGLTTIHAPLEQMGRLTAAYLLEPPSDDKARPHIELPAELVVRGSTGRPAGNSPARRH